MREVLGGEERDRNSRFRAAFHAIEPLKVNKLDREVYVDDNRKLSRISLLTFYFTSSISRTESLDDKREAKTTFDQLCTQHLL